jgi:hypothetical protein
MLFDFGDEAVLTTTDQAGNIVRRAFAIVGITTVDDERCRVFRLSRRDHSLHGGVRRWFRFVSSRRNSQALLGSRPRRHRVSTPARLWNCRPNLSDSPGGMLPFALMR